MALLNVQNQPASLKNQGFVSDAGWSVCSPLSNRDILSG
jgi:hypothetical protein